MIGRHGKCIIVKARCPENGDPLKGLYCPCWVEVVETNDATGEVRTRSQCAHILTVDWMRNMVKHTNHGAAELSAMRSEVVKRFDTSMHLLEKRNAQS